ncbi:MAG: M24 family metallopeptidase [Prevotellaceae bacterium]|nr:M24 family metallopeptidase [Prevotellaceae bacterium]
MSTVNERVASLRKWMAEQGVEALVVPTMDPHNTEYVAEHWQCRRWISGFTGSAGTVVVTAREAYLWTDSRYWLQASEQLSGTPLSLKRDLVDETINQWLRSNVKGVVGYPADMMTKGLSAELFEGVNAQPLAQDPFDLLWEDRPAFPLTKAERMPDELAGETAKSKLSRLTQWMRERGKQELLVSDLAEVAWTLNLRGDDIPYTPFLISFLLARADGRHTLYIHKEQIGKEIEDYLTSLSVSLAPYEEAPREKEEDTPIAFWKAIKTPAEQEGFREAHRRDGAAMVKFLRLLDETGGKGWTELRADEVLTACRAEQPGFRGRSFETIVGYGPHGAIVHYEPTPETDVPLAPRSFLLIDSGGHYDCGSTDITRTIPLGTLTDEERLVYTLVLKGHLQLQNIHFPDGTVGLQLDTAARMPLWRAGYDYGHGTGHGVGHRLCVHEGPVQIRKNCRRDTTLPFHAGQNITNEPGLYIEGKFAVRHENTMLCVPAMENEYGKFLKFEPLTLCPYDLRPIIVGMLTAEERRWLNDYHQLVRETLTPRLKEEVDRQWLAQATRPI